MNSNPDLETAVLAAVAGAVAALLEPADFGEGQMQAEWQMRADFYKSGGMVRWINPGTDQAARKRYQRARDVLAGAGMLTVGGGGKRVSLTAAGSDRAKVLLGLPRLEESLVLLDWFMDPARDADRWDHGWLSESSMTGGAPLPAGTVGQPRIEEQTASRMVDAVLPLLAAGLVEWRVWSFGAGLFLYKLTAEGSALAAQRRADGTARPQDWPRLSKRGIKITEDNAAVWDAYLDGWEASYRARREAKPLWPCVVSHLDPVDPPRRGGTAQTFSAAGAADGNAKTTTPPNGGKE